MNVYKPISSQQDQPGVLPANGSASANSCQAVSEKAPPSLFHRIGWLPLYPLVFIFTVIVKFKNRRLATDEGYLHHQMEFFGFSRRLEGWLGRDFIAPSDKFHKLRPAINRYALADQSDRPPRVLDVATGCGFQAKSLKDAGAGGVCAIDVVAERVGQARDSFGDQGIVFAQMDAATQAFADGYFDAAVVSCALHDMPTGTKRRVLAEMARVTRPGGNVVILEPRTFASRPLGFLLGLLGELVDESLNMQEYVMDDLNPVLAEHGLQLLEEQNVAVFRVLNIKRCRVQPGLGQLLPGE